MSDTAENIRYEIRPTRLSVVPQGEPLFSERCTHLTIVNEAAGEFIEIEQQSGSTEIKLQTISMTPEEWPAIRKAIETLMQEIERADVQ